ncbi:MAG: WbqC family protein [Bacteroidaceae bacterium]|nr:WbqC family protein [Bacteroidaceae bacterium]
MVLPSYYLAPVAYYRQLLHSAEVRIEVCDHYAKQTLRNRCWIDSPSGPLALTVPVEKAEGKQMMRDVRISDHGNWRHQHWQALVSSYRQSPFFEFYADDFAPFYSRRWTFLADYNEELMQLICRLLEVEVTTERTTAYSASPDWQPDPTSARPYYQMFASRHGFLPDLSIVDLLFNMGNESILYL